MHRFSKPNFGLGLNRNIDYLTDSTRDLVVHYPQLW